MAVNVKAIVDKQKEFVQSGATLDVNFRKKALKILRACVKDMEQDITDAIRADLGRIEIESYTSELSTFYGEVDYAIKNIDAWVKPEKVPGSSSIFPGKCYIVPEPLGVTLIMAPWNYPFMMTLFPLIGAISAGDTAVIKPSAYAPECSHVIRQIVERCFPKKYVAVIEGSREENEALLEQPFDYIFFTGSVNVGKIVMEKAAKHLTPVTLELGGKNPVIVDETADLVLAAKRIVNTKFMNCGQTCVAPDYVFVHESVKDQFIEELATQLELQYAKGEDGKVTDYAHIINRKHFDRVVSLMEGQDVVIGGASDPETLYVEPTVIKDPALDSAVMAEEIFGPIIPVIGYEDLASAAAFINSRPKSLAMYLFSNDKERWTWFEQCMRFGGGCINDCMLHLATQTLPFGGVGASGMGAYHGKHTFTSFSHMKSILNKDTKIDFDLRYRPFTEKKIKMMRK